MIIIGGKRKKCPTTMIHGNDKLKKMKTLFVLIHHLFLHAFSGCPSFFASIYEKGKYRVLLDFVPMDR